MISSSPIRPATVLACLSLITQPILAQYSNSSVTTTVPPPTPTNGTGVGYGGWKYDGCYGSGADFPGFNLVATSPNMTVEYCQGYCFIGLYKYSALLERHFVPTNGCYCGNTLDIAASEESDNFCSYECPGNTNEHCGGPPILYKEKPKGKRDTVPAAYLVSLYEQIIPPAGIVYTTIIATTYLSVCPTGGLSTYSITSTLTLTHCGCTNPVIPTIPMVAVTTVCSCGMGGAASSVTLTVPLSSCPTHTAASVGTISITPFLTSGTSPKFTGAAAKLRKPVEGVVAILGVLAAGLAVF